MEKTRGFAKINDNLPTKLPERQTSKSAGYDFYIIEDFTILPGEIKMLPTNVKAYMQEDEMLLLFARSSLAIKKGLVLQNGTGIIDSDFFPNEIKVALRNISDTAVHLCKGERVAQGIFVKYLLADSGNLDNLRAGGFGSTSKEE